MNLNFRHPGIILAALGLVSGLLGTYVQGPGIGEAPHLGAYMTLTGVWFGLVVAVGVWVWGTRSAGAAATALAATWVGWEAAVNVAMQLDQHLLKAIAIPDAIIMSVSGICAGALGAFATWAGAALVTPTLRQTRILLSIVSTGALLGSLLQFSNRCDTAAVLLLPWQIAVASLLGIGLALPRQRAIGESLQIFEPEHRAMAMRILPAGAEVSAVDIPVVRSAT